MYQKLKTNKQQPKIGNNFIKHMTDKINIIPLTYKKTIKKSTRKSSPIAKLAKDVHRTFLKEFLKKYI